MEPGKVHKVAFDVGWLSQIFNNGHRIRVTVASTGAPFYEPNPNTGEPLTIDALARRRRRRRTRSTTSGARVADPRADAGRQSAECETASATGRRLRFRNDRTDT